MRSVNWLWILGSCTIFACASIVGIGEAELDPEQSGGAGGTGGARGGAGNAGRAGSSSPGGEGGTPAGAGGEPSAGVGGQGTAGAGGEAGGTGEAGSGGEGGGGTFDLCPTYCETVMRNCTAPFQVYTSVEVCLRACAVLPQGRPGTETGNSVACRLSHAEHIELIGEAGTQCPIAGPGGDGVCGDNCDGFCTLRQGICDAGLDLRACDTECGALVDLGGYTTSQDSGGSVQCRLYHVSAATFGTAVHCPHAAGAPPCAAVP